MNRMTTKALPSHLRALVPVSGFSETTLLIVGDLMLDRYVVGDVHRISPEAPVPVLRVQEERCTAGGAGNVALNVAGLGARAILSGIVGNDSTGRALLSVLAKRKVDTSGILVEATRPTTSKTRIMSGSHQLVRVDEEITTEISSELADRLAERIGSLLHQNIHGVLLSDYAKGVLSPALLRFIIDECLKRNIPVFVDPKRDDYRAYSKATCLTPNLKEFHAAAAALGISPQDVAAGGSQLREQLECPMLLITQGADGMTLITSDQVRHFSALAEDVFDVSGAGDTVVATYAAAFAAGVHPVAAVELSNIAASIVVRKVGTAPIAWEELCPLAQDTPSRPYASEELPSAARLGKSGN